MSPEDPIRKLLVKDLLAVLMVLRMIEKYPVRGAIALVARTLGWPNGHVSMAISRAERALGYELFSMTPGGKHRRFRTKEGGEFLFAYRQLIFPLQKLLLVDDIDFLENEPTPISKKRGKG